MFTNNRKSYSSIVLILVGLSLLLVQTAMAGGNGTTRIVIPITEFFTKGIFNMCYGESGELVTDLSGYAQILMKNSGDTTMLHLSGIGNFKGVGAVSGDTYHINGALQDVVVKAGESFVHNFSVVGPGPDNNYIWRQRFQIHMTADGPVITSYVDDEYCR